MRATRKTTRQKAGTNARTPPISLARKPRTAEQIASSNAKRKATIAAKKWNNRTFQRFNELPKELRLMIWEAALPERRVVSIESAPLQYTVGEWNQRVDEQTLRDGDDKKDEPYLAESLANKTYLSDGVILKLLSKGVGFTRLQHILGMSTATELHDFFQATLHEMHSTGTVHVYESIDYHLAKRVSGIKSSKPPQILFACKESRTAALKVSPGYSSMSFARHGAVPETCFDGHQDTLYIRDTLEASGKYLFPGLSDTVRYLTTIQDVETLSKIEHLAILLDQNQSVFGGGYWYSELLHLDNLLRHLTGIKKLTFVVQHFGEWGTDTSEEIFFIDPINIESTIRLYESYSEGIDEEDPLRAAEMPGSEDQGYDFDWARLDSQSVVAQNATSIQLGRPALVYPPIEYKVAITSSYKKELVRLETARKDCQAKCNAHNIKLMKWLETAIKA
jgi:hypothetical protein